MPRFRYRAYPLDNPANITEAEMESFSKDDATAKLMATGFMPLSVEEVSEDKSLAQFEIPSFGDRVRVQDLAFFTRQLSTLLGSGIPIIEALQIAEDGTERKKLKEAVATVRGDVGQGVPLSAALAKHDDIFTPLYSSLVHAGESGDLPAALIRLADMLETDAQNRREVKGAMVYPVGVLIFSGIIFIAMMLFVVPAFQGIFDQAGGSLPLPTKILVVLSDNARKFWYLIPFVIGGGIYGFKQLRRNEQFAEWWDGLKLKLPLGLGELTQKVITARFARTLSTLQNSGVPVLQALGIAAPTTGNIVVERAIREAQDALKNGQPLSKALRASGAFPDMAMSMLESGEKAGKIGEMLDRVAATYEAELSNSIKALKSVMEPAMMVVIGLFIGMIVIALYMPMFSVYDQIK